MLKVIAIVTLGVVSLFIITAVLTLVAPYLAALFVAWMIYQLVVEMLKSEHKKKNPPE